MSKNTLLYRFLVIVLVVLVAGCSEFRKIQKNPDWKVKYKAAMSYYEKKDYYRANLLFEEILPIIRGSEEAEKVQFYSAYSFYHQKQYVMASHSFKRFFETYNRSEFAQEALYMHSYALYLQSPATNLDQSSSMEAIGALQTFINRYPYSEYTEKATKIIDEMQYKLETKAFDNAKQYYKLERLKSAMVAFENFQKDYPDSRYQEEVAYLLIESQYKIAKQSFQKLQEERYRKMIKYYQDFIDTYPESKLIKQAEGMYASALDELQKLAKNNS